MFLMLFISRNACLTPFSFCFVFFSFHFDNNHIWILSSTSSKSFWILIMKKQKKEASGWNRYRFDKKQYWTIRAMSPTLVKLLSWRRKPRILSRAARFRFHLWMKKAWSQVGIERFIDGSAFIREHALRNQIQTSSFCFSTLLFSLQIPFLCSLSLPWNYLSHPPPTRFLQSRAFQLLSTSLVLLISQPRC